MRQAALALAVAVAACATRAATAQAPPTLPPVNTASITSMSQFRPMSDTELEAYFAAGTAVMPSQEPPYNATGKPLYDFCVGRTYMNAFSANSSIARSVWPVGLDNPFNNIYERIWWGKVFYNDGSNPRQVQAWNLMGSNKTVGFTALAYVNATSPYGDGKPSVLMDFSQMEDRVVRPFVDEIRYINNNIWLGRSYVYNEWSVQRKEGKAYSDKLNAAAIAAVNSTVTDLLAWGGVSKSNSEGQQGLPSTDGFYFFGYFAFQCVGPKTPKLRYAAIAYWDALQGVKRGFLPPDYQLPALPATADDGAVAGPGFPAASESWEGYFPKLHIWPFRRSDVRLGSNLTQLSPWKGEVVHGEVALYPLVARAMQDWRDGNRSAWGWAPTDAQRAAVKDIEKDKILALAEAIDAHAVYAGEAFPLVPGAPVNTSEPPVLAPPLTEWAIHAITAANAAVKDAADNPDRGNPVAAAISAAKYAGQLKISVAADAASMAYSAVAGPKPLGTNATALAGLAEIKRTLTLNRTVTSPKPVTQFEPAWDPKAVLNATKRLPPAPVANRTPKPFNATAFKEEIVNAATPIKLGPKSNADSRPVRPWTGSRLGVGR